MRWKQDEVARVEAGRERDLLNEDGAGCEGSRTRCGCEDEVRYEDEVRLRRTTKKQVEAGEAGSGGRV